ncbi:hypothetical protein [Sphingomonas sp. PvP055]|uniref:hypothetical protein n=1 Tax=Sphingomonas sp. PvP055 TaxID=3156391 RepID=UPI0033942FED
MIDFFSTADRQELAKDQISKAIRALKRGDITSAELHLEGAFILISRAPTNLEWKDLKVEVENLRTTLGNCW